MRILVACELCQRQYEAGALPAGAFFRCRCGAKVRVPSVTAKDAAVVRCSSCGGPRLGGEPACRYCKADFTLHEQDLETMCPGCLARVSNAARFCHHCGVPILAEEAAGGESDRPCPACGPAKLLRSRTFGVEPVSVLECNACGGIWLAQTSFALLQDRARARSEEPQLPGADTDRKRANTIASSKGPLYRRCPACKEMMHRLNFGKRSGVIIDSCKDHGVWFDADELESALAWIKKGGEERAKKAIEEEARVPVSAKFFRDKLDRMAGAEAKRDDGPEWFGSLLGSLFDL